MTNASSLFQEGASLQSSSEGECKRELKADDRSDMVCYEGSTCRKPPTPPEWIEASSPALELPEEDPERLKKEVKLPALPAKKLLQPLLSQLTLCEDCRISIG